MQRHLLLKLQNLSLPTRILMMLRILPLRPRILPLIPLILPLIPWILPLIPRILPLRPRILPLIPRILPMRPYYLPSRPAEMQRSGAPPLSGLQPPFSSCIFLSVLSSYDSSSFVHDGNLPQGTVIGSCLGAAAEPDLLNSLSQNFTA